MNVSLGSQFSSFNPNSFYLTFKVTLVLLYSNMLIIWKYEKRSKKNSGSKPFQMEHTALTLSSLLGKLLLHLWPNHNYTLINSLFLLSSFQWFSCFIPVFPHECKRKIREIIPRCKRNNSRYISLLWLNWISFCSLDCTIHVCIGSCWSCHEIFPSSFGIWNASDRSWKLSKLLVA